MLHLSINNKDVAFGINENIARNKVPYFVGVTEKSSLYSLKEKYKSKSQVV